MLESLFKKSCRSRPATFLKKRLRHSCFSAKIPKILRARILKNIIKKATSETARNSCKSTYYRKTLKFVDKKYVEPKNEIIIATYLIATRSISDKAYVPEKTEYIYRKFK